MVLFYFQVIWAGVLLDPLRSVQFSSGVDSGWDNSPRWNSGIVEAVDLNGWLHLGQLFLTEMARELGKDDAEVKASQSQIVAAVPLFFKMTCKPNLDLRCVLAPALWVLGPKRVSNPDSVMKKFNPHLIYDSFFFLALAEQGSGGSQADATKAVGCIGKCVLGPALPSNASGSGAFRQGQDSSKRSGRF